MRGSGDVLRDSYSRTSDAAGGRSNASALEEKAMRTIFRTTPAVSAGALLLIFLWAAPAWTAGSSTYFKARFSNKSVTVVRVDILHTDGKVQKGETINPGSGHSFWFGSKKCDYTKTRKFRITEKANNTVIGTGEFTMKTGKSTFGGCNDVKMVMEFTECKDEPNDRYAVKCEASDKNEDKDHGWVNVTNVS